MSVFKEGVCVPDSEEEMVPVLCIKIIILYFPNIALNLLMDLWG